LESVIFFRPAPRTNKLNLAVARRPTAGSASINRDLLERLNQISSKPRDSLLSGAKIVTEVLLIP
jgi:hypothetical protein